jgi:hypothetical protein
MLTKSAVLRETGHRQAYRQRYMSPATIMSPRLQALVKASPLRDPNGRTCPILVVALQNAACVQLPGLGVSCALTGLQ